MTTTMTTRSGSDQGFTLIEVMISMLVLSTGVARALERGRARRPAA